MVVVLCLSVLDGVVEAQGKHVLKGRYRGRIWSFGGAGITEVKGRINKRGKLVLKYLSGPCKRGKRSVVAFVDDGVNGVFCFDGTATAFFGDGVCAKTTITGCGELDMPIIIPTLRGQWSTSSDAGGFELIHRKRRR